MSTYYYEFQKEKKLNATTTRMANVKVFNAKGNQIGCETVARWQKPDEVVGMIVRDYELQKIWNSKEFSFNQ